MLATCSTCKPRQRTVRLFCWLVQTVARYVEEFRFDSETRETRASLLFRSRYFSRRAREFLQNLGRIRKIGRACRIVSGLGAFLRREAAKRLHETVVDLFWRASVPASACWNIGCFENKRFSVFAIATSSRALDGLVLTV